jgi:hypothetical protein
MRAGSGLLHLSAALAAVLMALQAAAVVKLRPLAADTFVAGSWRSHVSVASAGAAAGVSTLTKSRSTWFPVVGVLCVFAL